MLSLPSLRIMNKQILNDIFDKNYEKHSLKKLIIEQLLKAVNDIVDKNGDVHGKDGKYKNKNGINLPLNLNVNDLNIIEYSQQDINDFKKHGSVSEFYHNNIQGKEITHSDKRLGKIYFDEDGLGESKHINRPKNFFLISKAVELVKNSKYDRWEYPDKHERNDDISKFHIVYAKAKTPKNTRIVQIKIAELDNGKKYYFLRPVLTI